MDEIIDILNASDIKNILSEIDFRGKKDRDPFTFFYEDFLNLYDPKKRKHLGIYYTPRPVVNFIVNSVNRILKEDFNKLHGFADDDVTVLDPAVGTGTFLWIVFLLTLGELINSGLKGLIKNKIENHILKDFYGFEILITPYIISHLKLTTVLRQWYYKFKDNDRIQVYLTNTLEPSETHGLLPFMGELTEESLAAERIKKKPILVILANPPYSGISANKGKWIDDLLKKGYTRVDDSKDDGYYKVDGKPLGERNPKWLQDDYVKFIRFAQWKMDKRGDGVIGFITNHSYLDNPTFRGMRQSLIDSFDRIYILNLHGNSLKKETCPDGSKDENVFDIRQGVAIALFVKNGKFKDKKVFYADLYGKRKEKYHWLDTNRVNTVEWKEIEPGSPYYFFIPIDSSLQSEYEKYWKVTDIFPLNGVGMTTARDHFVINFDKNVLLNRIRLFKNSDYSDDKFHEVFQINKKKGWSIRKAWNMLQKIPDDELERYILPVLYRPFDNRWIFYHDSVVWRTAKRVMLHMIQENLGLIFHKREELSIPYSHFLVTKEIIEHGCLSPKTTCYLASLYLYSDSEKKLNINPELFKTLSDTYEKELTPEEIFYYIYAILYSNTYRTKYAEFLKIDYPRVPFTEDYNKFKHLSEIGKELTDLHLMKTKLETSTKFDVQGSNVVNSVKYKDNKVYINKDQFFEDVSKDIWNFYIGGYRVLDKWLKSRKNRELSSNEIEHFLQVVEIIKQTIEYMKKIDEIKVF